MPDVARGEPAAQQWVNQKPEYANWPTFPQLWVDGELVGGCDIIVEMFQRGELQPLVKETAEKFKEAE